MSDEATSREQLDRILARSILALEEGRRDSSRPEDRRLATDLLAELAPLLSDLVDGGDVSDRLVAVERLVGNRWFVDIAPFEEGLEEWHSFRKRYESVAEEPVADASGERGRSVDRSQVGSMPIAGATEEPDLRVGGLCLWIHGRADRHATEFWDANWLRVTARCVEGGGSVAVQGPILHLTELEAFVEECAELHRAPDGTATLDCAEPNLRLTLSASDGRGGVRAEASLTPDHLRQRHAFGFDIDQSALPDIIRQIRSIIERFPLRGRRG